MRYFNLLSDYSNGWSECWEIAYLQHTFFNNVASVKLVNLM
jgi:hypothetical protein